jgi:sigma-E factor negative regulatory protein RseC
MDEIRHRGVVSGISPESLNVTIISESACSDCHAKGICKASDQKEKEIEVAYRGDDLRIGQPVSVIMRGSSGLKALFLGYILPSIILLTALFLFIYLTKNEITGGLVSLATLVLYYFILYHFRDKLKTTFRFELEV